ncbi:MAG: tryptophan synthase subunit alpha [bacterium]|nr:tryptophan synthase subunit alpha [bacterium]
MIFNGQEEERAVVGVILTDALGRVLLQQRDERPELPYPGWWTLFGGTVEPGETPEDAMRRELREELDLDLPVTHWRTFDCPVRSEPGQVRTRNHQFSARIDQPLESLTLREGQAMRFFEPEQAATLELAFAQHVILRDYLRDVGGIDVGSNLVLLEPETTAPGQRYPLVIFLHGSGERGDDPALLYRHGLPRFLQTGGLLPESAYVLIPQCPTDSRWEYLLERLDGLVESTIHDHPIDRNRVYGAGFSMGSLGLWHWADAYPDRFAALLPVGGHGFKSWGGAHFVDPARTAGRTPVWMIHSAADEAVPVSGADDFSAALTAAGVTFGYTRYPDATHAQTSDRAFWDSIHYEWLFGQRRRAPGVRGVDAVARMFEQAKAESRSAFLPYFPIGFPNYTESLAAVEAMAAVGVDGFEIGIPFSDPVADGAVIQEATQIALDNGTTVRQCIQAVRELRGRGIDQPMLLMGYVNPLLAYGIEAFVRDAKAAGADGLIVPDLPPEEGAAFSEICRREGLALVFFLAPTSSAERIALVAPQASGFIYVVALTGVTGERSALPADLTTFIQRLRAQTGETPLVMGFGISRPEHVRMVRELVDGFIVGSALVRAGRDGSAAVRGLAEALRRAVDEE